MSPLTLDTTTEFGQRVARRLQEEEVVWLTTVDPNGRPQPSPVWFLWEDGSFLIYSQPNRPKLRNIGLNPRVALNFNSNAVGDDIVVFSGEAQIVPDAPLANGVAPYVAKYRDAIARLGTDPASFAADYSVAIRVTPTGLRGF
jgi:PPOX class probable F420-dependent enzyme